MTQDLLFPDLAPAECNSNVHWYTPKDIIGSVRETFGGRIELDPASCEEANRVVQAKRYYSLERGQDGLTLSWKAETLWLNPPYDNVQPWADRLLSALTNDEVCWAACLTNNATETKWWQSLANRASFICFPNRRIQFWGPLECGSQPRQGQTLFFLAAHPGRYVETAFCHQFGCLGLIVKGGGYV